MAVDRALIVDALPTSAQANANAWGARMLGIGSVAGFFVCVPDFPLVPSSIFFTYNPNRGNLDLPRIFPFLGSAQLEVLSVIASLVLLGTHFVTAATVKERVLVSSS